MPTGYTGFIENGKITTAKDFLMLCAKTFIPSLWDEPVGTPLPDVIEPTHYYEEELEKAEKRLNTLFRMTAEEKNMEGERLSREKTENDARIKKRNDTLIARYEAIKSAISSWDAPPECLRLKDFALDQIEKSMEQLTPSFVDTTKWSTEEWYENAVNNAIKDTHHYGMMALNAKKRVEGENAFLSSLREALKDVE